MTGLLRRVAGAALLAVLAAAACQPVDEIGDLGPMEDEQAEGDADRRGAPRTGAPETLDDARASGEAGALAWQRGARLAEVVVDVDESGRPVEVLLTYLAPDADRFLTVEVGADGVSQERPTLGTLDLEALPGVAVEAVPPLPEGTREPEDLVGAAGEGLAGCGAQGTPATVLYTTGAPLGWDPESGVWTQDLAWTATVTTAEGAGVVLDPVTAAVLDCVTPAG